MFFETDSNPNDIPKGPVVLELVHHAVLTQNFPDLIAAAKELALLVPRKASPPTNEGFQLYLAYLLVTAALLNNSKCVPGAITSLRDIARHAPFPELQHEAAATLVKHAGELRRPKDRVAACLDAACFSRSGSKEEQQAVRAFGQSVEELTVFDQIAAYRQAKIQARAHSELEGRGIVGYVTLANKYLPPEAGIPAIAEAMKHKEEEPASPGFLPAMDALSLEQLRIT